MSKKEKIKSLKKTVKDLKAQVRKLKLAAGSKKTKSAKPDAPKPQMPTAPSAVKVVAKPDVPKTVIAPRVAG
ncbi:MAG: hypothetical protein JO254_04790 [Pseudolabrys sp.]|nr:hypothetical protein [Pseudolabrys sp.]